MTVEKKISAKVITPVALSQQEQTARGTSNKVRLVFVLLLIRWNKLERDF